MKKYILCMILTFLSICICPIRVYAEESTESTEEELPETETNEKGHIVNGYVCAKENVSDGNGYNVYKFLNFSGKNAVIYFINNGTYYILHSYDVMSGKWVSATAKYSYYWIDRSNVEHTIIKDSLETFPNIDTAKKYSTFEIGKCFSFQTNIPIFTEGDTESVENYVNNGDYSGAENVEEISKDIPNNDTSVEGPQGLKVSGGYATGISSAYSFDKDFVCNWNQTVDTSDYLYDVQARCTLSIVTDSGSTALTGENYSSDWIDFGTKNYDGAINITHKITMDNLNDKLLESALANAMEKSGKKLTYKGYLIGKLQVRFRNRVADKCSDWYVATIDYNGTSTTGTLEDDDGNVIEDDGDIADTSDTDDTNVNINSNIATILNYIKSGFGLLGNTGIISLMSKCFVYLPASIWTMLKFLVAMMVIMAVISGIKKLVF